MAFISYAQNFEDVMLWRALKHISEGFYIDVGANDPSIDSVTRAFYERGWHGINIEPLPSHAADLRAQRERDINLQCAAGAECGELELWECDVRGWATASQEVVAQHAANGHEGIFQKVLVRRLAEICEEFVSGDIHFLKIDVEGFEESVIRGMDFSQFRPWILVIEATKPNSPTEAHDEWESIVLGAEYLLAYCDGLNRYYVVKEHSELLDSLRYPPNVFDGFIRSEQLSAELRAQQAEGKAQQLESRAATDAAESSAAVAQARAATAEAESRAAVAEARSATAEAESRAAVAEALAATAEAESRAAMAESRATDAVVRAQQTEAHALELQRNLDAVHNANHHHWQLAEDRAKQIQAIYLSHSWRITFLLRWVGAWLRKFSGVSKAREISRDPVGHVIRYVLVRPRLKRLAVRILGLFPGIESRLRSERAAQLRADFMVVRTSVSSSIQAASVSSGIAFQKGEPLTFLSPDASRQFSIDEILQRIRAELVGLQVEK